MMRSRSSLLLAITLLLGISFMFIGLFSPNSSSTSTLHSIHNQLSNKALSTVTDFFSSSEQGLVRKKPRYAIASSAQTASFTAYALMLGYSIQKHNDLASMDAEMVLIVREQGADGVTKENRTRLEAAGWKVKVVKDLNFKGVDNSKIRAHHRHNLNKLVLWSWTEYDKILFIDADVVCKGSLKDLWGIPGDFAAAPDVWWDILTDNRFNSGVIMLRPSMQEFHNLIRKVSDPEYHKPNDADQAFLNIYYRFRYWGLPYKYNFNLVMYQFHRPYWDQLWDEAILVHFTVRKPTPDPINHCHEGCNEQGPVEWYGMLFSEMLAFYGWEGEIPVHA